MVENKMAALCKSVLVLLAVSGLMVLVYADQKSCIGEAGLGEVLDVVYPQGSRKYRLTGAPVTITIRIRTPFPPSATWRLETSEILGGRKIVRNEYVVPEMGDRDIRTETRSEGSDTYSFNLHFDFSYNPTTIFYLHLQHPCNEITIWGHLFQWSAVNGTDLPTVLAVPRPVVNLTTADQVKMAFGLKAASGYEIYNRISYIRRIRENDMIREPERIMFANHKPVRLGFEPRRIGRTQPRVEGKLVINKEAEGPGDVQSMTNVFQYSLQVPRTSFRVYMYTQILLQGTLDVPGIMVSPLQSYTHLLRKVNDERNDFYDTDGTRILPYVRVKNARTRLPEVVFQCLAEGSESTPAITTYRFRGTGEDVMQALTSEMAFGIASSEYAVVALELDRRYDFKCSAAVGNIVKDLPFRIVVIQAINITSPNATEVRVDENTFANGFTFTCRAEGSTNATINFYKVGRDYIFFPPSGNRVMTFNQPLQPSQRFRIEKQANQASLFITPGDTPFTTEDYLHRFACVGFDQFTVDMAYVDFRMR